MRCPYRIFGIITSFSPFVHRQYSKFSNIFMDHYNKVFVCIPNNDIMDISFVYGTNMLPDTVFSFSRMKNERLFESLRRVQQKIEEALAKSKTRKFKKAKLLNDVGCSQNAALKIQLSVLCDGDVVDGDVPNMQAWIEGNRLKIDDALYDIVFDPPSVTQLLLPKKLKSGFPVYPTVQLKSCSLSESKFTWYRSLSEAEAAKLNENNILVDRFHRLWFKVGEDYVYNTTTEDVGHNLKITCIPKCAENVGMIKEATTSIQVAEGPGRCPFEIRHELTNFITPNDSIRCVSYNILADLYADSETARTDIFPYCPREFLSLDYRKQLLLKEILGYNGDIMCLQEVDVKVFQSVLSPALSLSDLHGVFTEKANNAGEGVACFFRQNKFRLVHNESIILSEAIQNDSSYQDIWNKVQENEKLKEKILSKNTVLQVVVLESLTEILTRRIIVANTHMYFHPQAPDVRLVHSAVCVRHLENLVEKYRCETPDVQTSFMFSGDFNSCPDYGVFKFVTQGSVSKDCPDWSCNSNEAFEGMNLQHSLQFESACGTPPYTNYTEKFSGCLDYIFYDRDSLTVSEVVPFPEHELITADKALPSRFFPSDHLALVCVLKWK